MTPDAFLHLHKMAEPWTRAWTVATAPASEMVERFNEHASEMTRRMSDATAEAVDQWAEVTKSTVKWMTEVSTGMRDAAMQAYAAAKPEAPAAAPTEAKPS